MVGVFLERERQRSEQAVSAKDPQRSKLPAYGLPSTEIALSYAIYIHFVLPPRSPQNSMAPSNPLSAPTARSSTKPPPGRDLCSLRSLRAGRGFNQRAPRGARRPSVGAAADRSRFNPRAPRGARRYPYVNSPPGIQCFNPRAPAWGATFHPGVLGPTDAWIRQVSVQTCCKRREASVQS